MKLDLNDDILQDFLLEAGEILEQLGEQLVELENAPENNDLLNSIFRGFHTIKGGAGFVSLDRMVEICHRAEDVFNVLRQGQRKADPDLMDSMLRVLDVLHDMFNQTRAGDAPTAASPDLLAALRNFTEPQLELGSSSSTASDKSLAPHESVVHLTDDATNHSVTPTVKGDVTDEDFEGFLDSLQSSADEISTPEDPPKEDITDQEFEALLDQLHGTGKAPKGVQASKPRGELAQSCDVAAKVQEMPSAASDDITEDEFEQLLDTLHGEGCAPGAAGSQPEEDSTQSRVFQERTGGGRIQQELTASSSEKASPKSQTETTVRVDTKRLDEIMNLVGELVLVRNRLTSLQGTRADEEVGKAISNLDMVTSGLQAAVMKTRMQPIKKVFGRFPRVVRDLARSLNKEVQLTMRGEETDLDKNLVEALADPLVHLVRNSVDHGVENPDEREQFGKPRTGQVVLSASQEGDHILLTIEDNGRGMDPHVLRRKAVEKGLMEPEVAQRLSDNDVYHLIFMAGFSTKSDISDISGRGVGMDVVKTRIEQLNGTIEIISQKGRGTVVRIKVPLTLAILSTLMVVVGNQRFALPLSSVDEILDFDPKTTRVVDNQEVFLVRKKAMAVFYLRQWLTDIGLTMEADHAGHVVVVHVGTQRVGLVVDHLIGQEEVVIKPLGAYLQGLPGFAGATITGDGRIALILDIVSLMKANVGAY
jgi:two-component system chemotaxis sensor kinase CheA